MAKENKKVTENINIEGAELRFRNFAGRASEYNAEGDRNFAVLLDEDLAEQLQEDGWNVKRLKPRDEDDNPDGTPYLSVKVRFDPFPPIIQLITSAGKTKIDQDSAWQLDDAIIENADIIIRPYNYPSIAGRPGGVSAYLKAAYITIEEDAFARKYADLPER